MKNRRQLLLVCLVAFSASSCATKQCELNLSAHPDLPGARVAHLMRHIAERSEKLSALTLWGNYGGPGCVGGKPIDAMDELFRQHDLAYLQGVKRRELIEADQRLISQLESLDPNDLTANANGFRKRAIKYFSRPISRVLGKPPNVIFGLKSRPVVIDISDAK